MRHPLLPLVDQPTERRPRLAVTPAVAALALPVLLLAPVHAPAQTYQRPAWRRPVPAAAPAQTAQSTPAQASAPQGSLPAPAAATISPPVPAEPQRTTASFGLWTLRCERPASAPAVCEAVQTTANAQGQPVAQVAIGRPARHEPLRMTALLPASVTLTSAPRLVPAEPGKDAAADAPPLDMTWRRCLPGGCVADVSLPDPALQRLRARTEPSRIAFLDGAGREAVLPFAPQGLPQALDALAKEDAP